jgi:histidyl-tRNA synthetase
MKSNFQNVRGTQDFFGEQSYKYNYIVNVAKKFAKLYNFEEIIPPIIENSNLFERNLGDGSDVILKELYKFEDKGGNMLALRPEFTAGVVRSLVSNGELNQNLPKKLFSFGSVFRYDRPQKGRYRQLNQINFEMFGNADYMADIEMITLYYDILKDLGLKNIVLEINSLGSNECKKKYENALIEYFTKYENDLSEDSKLRLKKNPLRIIDSKEECDKKLFKEAPKIYEFYTQDEEIFYKNVLNGLDYINIKYFNNPLLVRGLDYYTATVFEFTTTDLGSQSAVGGGGRYDNLVEQIGNEKVTAVGFAGGIERLILLLNNEIVVDEDIIAIIPVTENENLYAFSLVNKLREQGKSVEYIYGNKFKKRMEKLNKTNANFLIIVGEDEIKNNALKIKNLKTGEEKDFYV